MLIISAGMQKSGSAYFYSVINELWISAGNPDSRSIKEKYNLTKLIKTYNNSIGRPYFYKLFRLLRISRKEGGLVVKSHGAPTLTMKILCRLGLVKVIYSYRDPRDVLLSAIDHGNRILAAGERHTFAKMVSFDKALSYVGKWLRVWKKYNDMKGVITVKYEEMMENPVETTNKLQKFLDISVSEKARDDILWKFSKENPGGDRKGMHFNKAEIYRYRSRMTQQQKEQCKSSFGDYIRAMSYDLN